VGPGSQAGFRAHEKFAEIATPHEAVALTDRLAGWITVREDGSAIEVTGACIAVELASLPKAANFVVVDSHVTLELAVAFQRP
jgi:hypothetical protein